MVVVSHGITQVYQLAAALSATGEGHLWAWELNKSLLNVLKLTRDNKLGRLFWPSSFCRDASKEINASS